MNFLSGIGLLLAVYYWFAFGMTRKRWVGMIIGGFLICISGIFNPGSEYLCIGMGMVLTGSAMYFVLER